ncbi:MAG: pilus assembly PilX N-terminal domain-containing protein [Burkholderiales bacterium]|jgi:hypothetical protein|nr:pilus assembly PilX N-terminal domain-containing protein [Burkholderiales bacterium]
MNRFFYTHKTQRVRHSERGMVLIVTLLILVAMLLVSTALLRSSDTSVQVVSNLSFRQAAEAPTNIAVERVIRDFSDFNVGALTSLPDHFYGRRQTDESPEGIPQLLLTRRTAPGSGYGFIPVSDMNVSYVVERMCADDSPPTATNCMLSSGGSAAVENHNDAEIGAAGGAGVVHRVSIRVDGVRETTVFAQAFIN